jgi:cellulose synthase/poly-beta-1,6-N-acetylglucosamine synthase-like glycosyltransferase
VRSVGGWEPELAEDTDVSVRMVRAGWRLRFAPDAVAWTDVPETMRALVRQRIRWDRGGFCTQFSRHAGMHNPAVMGWRYATEVWTHTLFAVVATFVYPYYIAWLIAQGLEVWLFVMLVSSALYMVLSLLVLLPMTTLTIRVERPWRFVGVALVSPFLKGALRWARLYGFCLEIAKVKSNDSFLPDPVWANAPPI